MGFGIEFTRLGFRACGAGGSDHLADSVLSLVSTGFLDSTDRVFTMISRTTVLILLRPIALLHSTVEILH